MDKWHQDELLAERSKGTAHDYTNTPIKHGGGNVIAMEIGH